MDNEPFYGLTPLTGLNFQQAIPKILWEQTTGPLADFIKAQWAAWTDEVSRKLEEELEIERWLRDLQSRPLKNPEA